MLPKFRLYIICFTLILSSCASNDKLSRGVAADARQHSSYLATHLLENKNFTPIVMLKFGDLENAIVLNKSTIDGVEFFFYTFCNKKNSEGLAEDCQAIAEAYVFPYKMFNTFMGSVTDNIGHSVDGVNAVFLKTLVAGVLGLVAGASVKANNRIEREGRSQRGGIIGAVLGFLSSMTYDVYQYKKVKSEFKIIDVKRLMDEVKDSDGDRTSLQMANQYKVFAKSIEFVSTGIKAGIDVNGNLTLLLGH